MKQIGYSVMTQIEYFNSIMLENVPCTKMGEPLVMPFLGHRDYPANVVPLLVASSGMTEEDLKEYIGAFMLTFQSALLDDRIKYVEIIGKVKMNTRRYKVLTEVFGFTSKDKKYKGYLHKEL